MARNGNQGSAQQPTPQPRRQPQMAPDVRADFENAALKIATEFEYNLNDLKSTYEAKPESLKQAFDTMSQAKSDRQSWIGWTVGWTVAGALTGGLLFLAAAYTGYCAYEDHQKVQNVGCPHENFRRKLNVLFS